MSETFRYVHGGSNTTCTLIRPKLYKFYGTAESIAKGKHLGTTRDIWIASYNKNTCADAQLKLYKMIIGATLLSFVGLSIFVVALLNKLNFIKVSDFDED